MGHIPSEYYLYYEMHVSYGECAGKETCITSSTEHQIFFPENIKTAPRKGLLLVI